MDRPLHVATMLAAAAAFSASACIDARLPPEPTRQVAVPYGPKIYLVDRTIGDRPDRCFLLGEVISSSTSTTVGGELVMDPTKAYNCFVEVASGELRVDQIEVTNELFQLCVDSTVCKKPDPVDVDKAPVCSNEDQFDTCPVLSVQQVEAQRFCEFVGRRLPSMVEAIVARQGNRPQTPGEVTAYAYGADAPTSCDRAVLKTCGKPAPMTVSEDGAVEGAARLDKTAQNVYDLTGNASEWARDLLPAIRGPAENLPWFCVRPLADTDVDGQGLPRCPDGEVCVRGEYTVTTSAGATRREDFPVCIADSNLAITNGTVGSIMGGNFSNSEPTPVSAGIFVRQSKERPNADPGDATHGFRCVGEPGVGGGIVPTPRN